MDGSVSDDLQPEQATTLVQARLGRLPQDMLEAAVVLEAWAGLQARSALDMGRQIVRRQSRERAKPVKNKKDKLPPATGILVEGLSLLAVVAAVATWASPLSRALGADAVRLALLIALPLTLALQWGLSKRYLAAQNALAMLAADRFGLLAFAVFVFAVPPAVLAFTGAVLTGAVASMMAVTWVSGAIFIRRGWGHWYALGVVATAVAMELGPPSVVVLAAAAGASLGAAAAALRSQGEDSPRPSTWGKTIVTAFIGATLGVLLVGDSSVGWGLTGAIPAVALIPSTVGSFWGALYLRGFHERVPRALSGMSIEHRERYSLRSPAVKVLFGAVLRVCLTTGVLSAALVIGEDLMGVDSSAISLLVGFGCVALATLIVSMLEAMGSLAWACMSSIAAVAAELVLVVQLDIGLSGAGLLAGSLVALAVGLPRLLALFRRPATLVATNLWVA